MATQIWEPKSQCSLWTVFCCLPYYYQHWVKMFKTNLNSKEFLNHTLLTHYFFLAYLGWDTRDLKMLSLFIIIVSVPRLRFAGGNESYICSVQTEIIVKIIVKKLSFIKESKLHARPFCTQLEDYFHPFFSYLKIKYSYTSGIISPHSLSDKKNLSFLF